MTPDRSPICSRDLDLHDYEATIHAESDDHSDLAQYLQYWSRSRSDDRIDAALRRMKGGEDNLCIIAACIGDFACLEFLHNKFGGLLYDEEVAEVALQHRHFDFYIIYVQSSCGTNSDAESLQQFRWVGPLLRPLMHLLRISTRILSVQDREQLFIQIDREVVPMGPSMQDLYRQYLRRRNRDLSMNEIDSLVATYENYEDIQHHIESRLLDRSLSRDSMYKNIRTYLVEYRGLRFQECHVAKAAHMGHKRLYEYVLAHRASMAEAKRQRSDTPVLRKNHINDSHLLSLINDSFESFYWLKKPKISRCSDADCVRRDLAEKLFGRDELVAKLYRIMSFLRSEDFHTSLTRSQWVSFKEAVFRYCERVDKGKNPNLYAREMADFVQDVLNEMSSWTPHGFVKLATLSEAFVNFSRCHNSTRLGFNF